MSGGPASATPGAASDALHGAGFLSARVRAAVARDLGIAAEHAALVYRSPIGPLVVRVVPADDRVDWRELAAAASRLPWVRRANARRPSLYIAAVDDVVDDWLADAFAEPATTPRPAAGSRPVVAVADAGSAPRVLDPDAARRPAELASARTLTDFRVQVVAHGLAGVLGAAGGPAERLLVAAAADGDGLRPDPPADWELVPVGAVDVRQGPLLARHGGALYAADLVSHAARELVRRADAEDEAVALLALLLLRSDRVRHVAVGETQLDVAGESFRALCAARAWAAGGGAPAASARDGGGSPAAASARGGGGPSAASARGDESDRRTLVAYFDVLPGMVEAAARTRDPEPLARFLAALAGHVGRAGGQLGAEHPARRAAAVSIDFVLGLLGLAHGP